ncbi:MAG: phospholipid carrier-dependent glycosyltransferase, partial [Betaproteobacteria bacterium]
MHTAVFAWAVIQLRGGARETLALELEAGRAEAAGSPLERAARTAELRPPGGAGVPGRASVAPASSDAAPAATSATTSGPAGDETGAARQLVPADPAHAPRVRRVPAWFDRPLLADLAVVGWIRARMAETPFRRDRSRELDREGRGRFDRLDIWILIVIVVAALGLRTFRLAEPARMHFDEVYHARTATEFLQDWRYGISHSIYEWTHPHLAKYMMAAGLVLFAGHDVAATSQLGVNVRDAAIEPRRPDALSDASRLGDRAWIATGSQLIGYDLETRSVVARWAIPGASAVAFDRDGLQLYVGTDSGQLLGLDVSLLDGLGGANPDAMPVSPSPVTSLDGAISHLAVFDGGQRVAAMLPGDVVSVVDIGNRAEAGRVTVAGATDMLDSGTGDAIVATPVNVGDPATTAAELAKLLGGDAAAYAKDMARTDVDTIVLDASLTPSNRATVQQAIDDGLLPGIQIEPVPFLAVAGSSGVSFVSDRGTIASTAGLGRPATGMALVSGIDDGSQLWTTTTDATTGRPQIAVIAVSGDQAKTGPVQVTTIQLPGAGSRVVFDNASQMVEVLGTTPDDTGATIYVIEPHGKAVFADHKLPFAPSAWIMDHDPNYPTSSQGAILAFSGTGEVASVDIGHYPFAWRLPGVILGALTAGILYLLTRLLFRRRDVAVLAGLFVLLDGMAFVQSRIGMNDVYTGVFILAAYLLFAWLWLEPRRWRAFWVLMPVVGLLLGLGLASKWVAAYAIGALGILVLARSALGRLLLIAGLIGLAGVLGWMALAVPAGSGATGNLTFALLMIVLTLTAVVITVYHPIAWSAEEMWLAVAGPAALGILVVLGAIALGRADAAMVLGPVRLSPLSGGFALVVAGLVVYGGFQVAARLGFGPLVPATTTTTEAPPPSPPAEGWLRLGAGMGLPVLWMLGSLVVIPLVVYVVSYIPWALIENHQLWPGWPPGHTGQTLLDLTGAMYRYHNDLTAAHPASSPWWAWPLNLKPVWFYQGSFANGTAASIYDAGNMVIWWLGAPAMAFVAYQAFQRRSLALGLIVIGFLAQWFSWARIDRAAFQYHYYTSLPFIVMALAYFVA